jgi:hypothetical protein
MFLQIGLTGPSPGGLIVILGIFFAMIAAAIGLIAALFFGARRGTYAGLIITILAIVVLGLLGFADPELRESPDEILGWWAILVDTMPFALLGLGVGIVVAILLRLLVGLIRRTGSGVLAGAGRAALVYVATLASSIVAAVVLTAIAL